LHNQHKILAGFWQPSGFTETGSQLTIALTIGATIGLISLVLLLYGLFGGADYSRSDGININFWWGLLMVVFGILMSIGGYISSRRQVAH
jgi:uncharacterized membrane protein